MPDPIPRGDTSFRAIFRSFSVGEPVNVPGVGCVESVVTVRTHFRFDCPRLAGVVVLREAMLRPRSGVRTGSDPGDESTQGLDTGRVTALSRPVLRV